VILLGGLVKGCELVSHVAIRPLHEFFERMVLCLDIHLLDLKCGRSCVNLELAEISAVSDSSAISSRPHFVVQQGNLAESACFN
jgi:hypothetical protein